MPKNLDFTTDEFATVLDTLPPHLPISDGYDAEHGQKNGRWWSSQREHMVGWFDSQDTYGSGAYTRDTPNSSAKRAYNRLLAPGALLWIAEAVGVEPGIVQAAADMAVAESDHRRRCGKIRSVLTWELVAAAAAAKTASGASAAAPMPPAPENHPAARATNARQHPKSGMSRSMAARGRRLRRAQGGV